MVRKILCVFIIISISGMILPEIFAGDENSTVTIGLAVENAVDARSAVME